MIEGGVTDLGMDRRLIDLRFRSAPSLIGSYLLPLPEGWAMVETGPTRCRDRLLEGLGEAGVEPRDVRQVFVTHIHLDHSGGLGAVQDDLPNARFYAHELGVRHLVDPAKLDASARRAWGPVYDSILGPMVPVRADRMTGLRGGEEFALRDGTLKVLATPGHARHHLSFFDTRTKAMLTGDSAGVRLPTSGRARPATPPPDLDLAELFASLERMKQEGPENLWYTHYGAYHGGGAALDRYAGAVREWVEVARGAARERPEVAFVAQRLRDHELTRDPSLAGRRNEELEDLVSGTEMAAMGLVRYLELHGEISRAPT